MEIPVIVEGKIWHPEEVRQALDLGAWAVVVGTAITNPMAITPGFVAATGEVNPHGPLSRT